MKCRFRPIRKVGVIYAEQFFAEFLHRLINGGEIVKHILCPYAQAHYGTLVARPVIICFRQKKEIGHKAIFIHSIADTYVVPSGDHTAINRCPFYGIVGNSSPANHSFREKINVGLWVFFPIHCTPGHDHIIRTKIYSTCTGFCRNRHAAYIYAAIETAVIII